MIKKGLVAVSCIGLLAGLLAACSSSGDDGGKKAATDADKTAATESTETAEIIIYSGSQETPEVFDEKYGNALRKKFPNYTIKYIQSKQGSRFEDLVTSKQRFDIYYESIGAFTINLNQYGLGYDMTSLISKHKTDLTRFDPTMIDAIKQLSNGAIFGLPVFNMSLATFVNKDIFDRFGVPYPKDGMTWEEMTELSKKLTRTDNGVQYYGLHANELRYMRLNPFSMPYLDPQTHRATINANPNWRTFFQKAYLDLAVSDAYRQKIVDLREQKSEMSNLFHTDRTLAMDITISNVYYYFKEFKEMNWDLVSPPVFKEKPGVGSQPYPTYFGITNIAENKDAAMKVIHFLVSNEFQTGMVKSGVMPGIEDEATMKAFLTESLYKNKNLKGLYYHKFAPIPVKSKYDSNVETNYNGNIYHLQRGAFDLNTFMRNVEEQANKRADEEMAKDASKAK